VPGLPRPLKSAKAVARGADSIFAQGSITVPECGSDCLIVAAAHDPIADQFDISYSKRAAYLLPALAAVSIDKTIFHSFCIEQIFESQQDGELVDTTKVLIGGAGARPVGALMELWN